MSFISTIIGAAERVPLPDPVIRAVIHELCARTAAPMMVEMKLMRWLRRVAAGERRRWCVPGRPGSCRRASAASA
ncbi:MAG: hypothetical protein ACK5H7_33565, partial [Bradyrhizobium sp.]